MVVIPERGKVSCKPELLGWVCGLPHSEESRERDGKSGITDNFVNRVLSLNYRGRDNDKKLVACTRQSVLPQAKRRKMEDQKRKHGT